jgi:hypothetical protein
MNTRARIAALIAVAAVLGPIASADAKNHPYNAKLSSVPLTTDGGYPNPGGTALLIGRVNSKQLGPGTVWDYVTMTGHPEANVFTFKGTEYIWFVRGTVRDTFTGTSTIDEDGVQHVAVAGRLTRGTGRYRRARGRYEFNGTVPSGSTELTGRSSGRISF